MRAPCCSSSILLVFLSVLQNSEEFSCRATIAIFQKTGNNKHGVSSNVFVRVFLCVCVCVLAEGKP